MLRQIAVLAAFGSVTTIGYGPMPAGASSHIEIPSRLPSLPQTPGGVVRLGLHRHDAVEFAAPALREARRQCDAGQFDIVVANDARALPLAFAVANGAAVWADLHEWAPEEQSHIASWRILVAPYMRHLCRKYLPRCAAITTVSPLIADLYRSEFGVKAEVVRNAREYVSLEPTPVLTDRIRLVHSGVAVPERCIETLIDATLQLDERFTLDLYLVFGEDDSYRRHLSERARGSERIIFHEPVSPAELPRVLNDYDLGVYLLRPTTTNHRFMLPNKLFDFVQARIGLVFGSAAEIDGLIAEHALGLTVEGYRAADLAAALGALTARDVAGFKANAGRAAEVLNSQSDAELQGRIVQRLTERHRGG